MKHIATGRLWELLDYSPATGVFRWKTPTSNRVRIGEIAGSIGSHGYGMVELDSGSYTLHRLAWQYVFGEIPRGMNIDHINGRKDDNRIANLRLADKSQNGANSCRTKRNTSGFKGVTYRSAEKRYIAKIGVRGKHYTLGRFKTPEEAHAAYVAAAKKHFGEFARTV